MIAGMDDTRAATIVSDIVEGLRDVIRRHGVTYPEYRRAIGFVASAAERGELPLLLDVLLESVVDETAAATPGTTDSNVEGPFFAAGAPEIAAGADGVAHLPMRPDEPGDRLIFTGAVRATSGDPLAGAVLDVWQADGLGLYSRFAPGLPEWNLRGAVRPDADGRFSFHTVRPAPYQIPHDGSTGALIEAAGWHAWRPAHLHLRVTAPGHRTLISQLYFSGGEYNDSDVASAVKPELIITPTPTPEGGLTVTYDITLDRA